MGERGDAQELHQPHGKIERGQGGLGPHVHEHALFKKVDLILQGHEHGYARSKQLTLNTTTCTFLATDKYNSACVTDGTTRS